MNTPMEKNPVLNVFSVVNDDSLISLINQAQRRINFLSPGVSLAVAENLVLCMKRLGPDAVTITLDVDAEVYRLGYGEHEATKLLYEKMRSAGAMLTLHAGIRIGLLIADDTMMVFAPTPLLVEAGHRDPKASNAIILAEPPPPSIIRNLGLGKGGVTDQTVGLDVASQGTIETVGDDLKQNPPQKFDVARKLGVFNANLDFVEFELKGTFINRKTISIPKELLGLDIGEEIGSRLKASFNVVEANDKLSGQHLAQTKARIARVFLKILPGFGKAILRTDKSEFEEEVKCLRSDVIKFGTEVKEKLQAAMDRNREALLEAVLPRVLDHPPEDWKKADGSKRDDQRVKGLLDVELRKAFGNAEELIDEMEVKLLFKGVTYGSLKDEEFTKLAKEAFPSLKNILQEFEAVEGEMA